MDVAIDPLLVSICPVFVSIIDVGVTDLALSKVIIIYSLSRV